MKDDLRAYVERLAGHKILVIGDVILDEYVQGNTDRLSREAPIPVLEFESRRFIPGGAANPAANIVALGSQAVQVGVIGADDTATSLVSALASVGIAPHALVTDPGRPTTLKTRILARMGLRFPQQVARIDTLTRDPISSAVEAEICSQIRAQQPDAILLSDYHNGLLTPPVIACAQAIAREASIIVAVDAQGQLQKYVECDVIKCNADDARTALGRELRTDTDFADAAQTLRDQLHAKQAVVITRGADGATFADAGGLVGHLPAPKISNVFDTVGAGDTAIAVLTLGLIAGAALADAVQLANYASGIVVQHVGNYAPTAQDLLAALAD